MLIKFILQSKKIKSNDYIVPSSTQYQFECKFCKKQYPEDFSPINVKALKVHVRSDKHEIATPKGKYQKELEVLKFKYDEEESAKKRQKPKTQVNADSEKKEKKDAEMYLEFLAFTMSQNYSFAQISKLGRFLKILKGKGMGFLNRYSFSEKEISKVSTECFGPFIVDQLKEQLSTRPYSLSVDASTIGGENILALKVKYLEKQFDYQKQEDVTTIQNKIVGIKSFQESSTGEKMCEIVKEILFDNEAVKNNLIGISHDNASSLTGEKIGLVTLLKKELQSGEVKEENKNELFLEIHVMVSILL